jgi:hypothetical protein
LFNESGECLDPRASAQLELLAEQVLDFAAMLRLHKESARAYATDV